MALTSASTLADAQAQYRNSLRYRVDNDLARAKDLVEAILFLLEAKANRSAQEGSSLGFDTAALERRLEDAQTFVDSHPDATAAGAGTTYADLSGPRT